MWIALKQCYANAPLLIQLWVFVIGACVGSFLNVLIYRLPIMLQAQWQALSESFLGIAPTTPKTSLTLFYPSSTCPHCNKSIRPWHNIPILGYLILRGCCGQCRQPIHWRYPFVECLTGLLSVIVLLRFDLTLTTIAALFFVWILIALAFIDWDTQLLPDELTLPLLWIGLIANTQSLFVPLSNSVLSAAGAYMVLYLFVKAFNILTGKDGMGEGDFKLFSALGAWLGWQLLPLVLLMASFSGAIIGTIILKLTKNTKDTPIAFGPYLCIAGLTAMLFGDSLLNWYISLF